MDIVFEKAVELLESKQSFALAVIIADEGSTPRGEGSKMLILEDSIVATIGGGLMEAQIIKAARERIIPQKTAEVCAVDMYAKADIKNGSLYFIKDLIESEFSIARYIFFAKQSSSCIDSILKVMRKYVNNTNRINVNDECDENDAKAVCQLAVTRFRKEDLEEIKDVIDKANSSMSSMENEMTIRNWINF